MNIGINYIGDIDQNVYKYLLEKGYIQTIKFPGKFCNYEELENFMKFANETKANVDIHGLPDMVPAIHSKRFIENVKWDKINKILPQISRISTHMGVDNREKLTNYDFITFERNIEELKSRMSCEVGIENIPGGFQFDKETLAPEFISNTWKRSDFGVFDVSHAKLAAKDIGITYKQYLEKIKYKEKVKILHISGNIANSGVRKEQPDKHVMINEQEIGDIIQLLNEFPNTDLIISEYTFNTKYAYEKEIMIEAIVMATIVKTRKLDKSQKMLEKLEKELKEDSSNIEEVMRGENI